jgi:SET domain-containing protein
VVEIFKRRLKEKIMNDVMKIELVYPPVLTIALKWYRRSEKIEKLKKFITGTRDAKHLC